jgi:hypothetical protein
MRSENVAPPTCKKCGELMAWIGEHLSLVHGHCSTSLSASRAARSLRLRSGDYVTTCNPRPIRRSAPANSCLSRIAILVHSRDCIPVQDRPTRPLLRGRVSSGRSLCHDRSSQHAPWRRCLSRLVDRGAYHSSTLHSARGHASVARKIPLLSRLFDMSCAQAGVAAISTIETTTLSKLPSCLLFSWRSVEVDRSSLSHFTSAMHKSLCCSSSPLSPISDCGDNRQLATARINGPRETPAHAVENAFLHPDHRRVF